MGSCQYRARSAPTAVVTVTAGFRIVAKSASDGHRIARALRVRGVRTLAVPLTGGREVDVVVGRAFAHYVLRARQGSAVSARSSGPGSVSLRTAEGPVVLLMARAEVWSGPKPRSSDQAPVLGRRLPPGKSRLAFLRLVASDGSFEPPV